MERKREARDAPPARGPELGPDLDAMRACREAFGEDDGGEAEDFAAWVAEREPDRCRR